MRHVPIALAFALTINGCGTKSSPPAEPIVSEDTGTSTDLPSEDAAQSMLDVPVVTEDTSPSDSPAPTPDTDFEPDVITDTASTPDTNPAQDTAVAIDVASKDCNTPCPAGQLCFDGQCSANACNVAAFDQALFDKAQPLTENLLIAQQPDLSWEPSKIYHWNDLIQGLHAACDPGIAGHTFWIGDPTAPEDKKHVYGLVNLAAFLAQSMKETIRYDACDENNWDDTNGYKISNACGQLDQKYEDYDCDMACPKAPSLELTAMTQAAWWGAPGPMFCAPDDALIAAGVSTDGKTGYWDYNHDCWPYPAAEPGFQVDESVPAYLRPECQVYAGQKAGKYVFDGSGDSVEGCCWWGRGVIQTTGRCNFGKLNHFLGKSHLNPNQFAAPDSVAYPNIDFCANPEVICASTEHPELKWIAGLFYWMSEVQAYNQQGWIYTDALAAFVDGGFQGNAFIDAVSGIVNRGCHNPPCGTGPVDGLDDRRANFQKALTHMGLN